ncbi:MAG: dinitrogenase iron-molybdenum cofactor biosynthesis protein [Desulfomicrobium apsheronum]|nr:dinitrogenase iron-molybdenum cofactor biosynthesis protein [Desulfomicrobium apsheronum]
MMKDERGRQVLVVVQDGQVAPRFDLALEVVMSRDDADSVRTLILAQNSAEKLCHLILESGIDAVICGGIEEEHHQFLAWKKVKITDNVIGPMEWALGRWKAGLLKPGDIFERCVGWTASSHGES